MAAAGFRAGSRLSPAVLLTQNAVEEQEAAPNLAACPINHEHDLALANEVDAERKHDLATGQP